MTLDAVLDRIDSDLTAATNRLLELLRIPSISTDPAYAAECDSAADWLVHDLQTIGIEVGKRLTPGHPMVVGHIEGDGPHLLFYGHYDVQPVDPIELWSRDPQCVMDTMKRANGLYKRLLQEFEPPGIDPGIEQSLREFVEKRKQEGGAKTDF